MLKFDLGHEHLFIFAAFYYLSYVDVHHSSRVLTIMSTCATDVPVLSK